jgi:uncharacterized repeat protein (TIGR03803 family)
MSVRVGGFAAGLMWSATLFPCLAIAHAVPGAGTFHVVYYFTAGNDGANPVAGLVADPWGNLYGVTEHGGLQNSGTVFTTAANQNNANILYRFTGQSTGGTDGALPVGGLAIDNCNDSTKTCTLYGTTSQGGKSANCSNGCGTIFTVGTDGSAYTQLYSFSGSDGSNPVAGLALDSSGNLYGTTLYGGGTACGGTGCGTVFELAGGNFTTLYAFCMQTNCTDGQYPAAPVLVANGSIYGTTEFGGANDNGTVFEIENQQETLLYSFCNLTGICSNGAQPESGLVMDTSGNLYGTTYTGGNGSCSCGTAFKLEAGGDETVLHSFSANQNPQAGLTMDGEGNLYGAVPGGTGAEPEKKCSKGCSDGETFQIPPSGKFTVQHGFSSGKGATPINPPIVLTNGDIYGTTEFGGYPCPNHTTCGTIYEIQP